MPYHISNRGKIMTSDCSENMTDETIKSVLSEFGMPDVARITRIYESAR